MKSLLRLLLLDLMHLSMLSCWGGGRPGIGGGLDSSHHPAVRTFDRFNGLSSNILLTFSCYFDNLQMPRGGAFEQKLSAQFKCPAYAQPFPSPPPQQLNIDSALEVTIYKMFWKESLDIFLCRQCRVRIYG